MRGPALLELRRLKFVFMRSAWGSCPSRPLVLRLVEPLQLVETEPSQAR